MGCKRVVVKEWFSHFERSQFFQEVAQGFTRILIGSKTQKSHLVKTQRLSLSNNCFS